MLNSNEKRVNKYSKTLDYYPTPPWATRALFEHVMHPEGSCLEPACGNMDMTKVLEEYGMDVESKDIMMGEDFLKDDNEKYDWVITNPPFKQAREFVLKALPLANVGVAMFVRYTFLESKKRYHSLFKDNPPSIVAQFSERVSLVHGRLDKDAGSAVAYCWVVWDKRLPKQDSKFVFIPPCKESLSQLIDYEEDDPDGYDL